ncbi:MAG: aminodeoxychorismate/anthranilate synthase component II [Sphingobacteriia bacterium]|nr:aminodeoxychorismate/anthranilate synthase component II [Sphingobacteriia bacterium]
MLLVIDNFDSFTYNLVAYIKQLTNIEIILQRSDKISKKEIALMAPSKILISPGPSHPKYAKGSLDAIDYAYAKHTPLLGICLGHQAIGYYFGYNIIKLPYPMHGKVSKICTRQQGLFTNLPSVFNATRYHSLVIEQTDKLNALEIDAISEDDKSIMAVHHKTAPLYGIQFHPESILTDNGLKIINKFIN